ncbi:hypothetical protein LTR16_006210, partial [Cryomyces antarcticus]
SEILRAEFPGITVKHIDATLKLHKHLFPAYLVLDDLQGNYQAGVSPYMKNPRRGSGSERMPPSGYGPDALLKELAAAKKKVTKKQGKLNAVEESPLFRDGGMGETSMPRVFPHSLTQ